MAMTLVLLQHFMSAVLLLHNDGGHKSIHLTDGTHHQHLLASIVVLWKLPLDFGNTLTLSSIIL